MTTIGSIAPLWNRKERAAAEHVSARTTTPIVYAYYGAKYGKSLGRQRLLTEALARRAPLVFLEYGRGLRRPTGRWVARNVAVIQHAATWRYTRVGKRLGPISGRLDGLLLDRELRRLGIRDYVFWLSSPWPLMLYGMRTDRLVYDCIDPCFSDKTEDQRAFDHAEQRILGHAAYTFATAKMLLDRVRALGACRYALLENAAPDLVCQSKVEPNAELRRRGRPVIGYMGTFDERVDLALVMKLAKMLPDYTFALAGRVNGTHAALAKEVRNMPNVVMPGMLSFEDGDAFAAAFDVGLIPFTSGRISDAINPVKMWMYLRSGLPVVGTFTTELQRYSPYVQVGRTAEDVAIALRRAVQGETPTSAEQRRQFAALNTWDVRAEHAMRKLQEFGICDRD